MTGNYYWFQLFGGNTSQGYGKNYFQLEGGENSAAARKIYKLFQVQFPLFSKIFQPSDHTVRRAGVAIKMQK